MEGEWEEKEGQIFKGKIQLLEDGKPLLVEVSFGGEHQKDLSP